jgi:hypothetical protein
MREFGGAVAARVLALAAGLAVETPVATILFELPSAAPGGGALPGGVCLAGSWTARSLIRFAAVFATFACLR